MKKGLLAASLMAIIIVCGISLARNLAPYEDDGYVSSRERAIIKKFDQDGDGKLNQTERSEAESVIAAAQKREAEQKAAWMKRYDTDGDGRISESEKRAAQAEAEKQRAKGIERYDKDGDGKIDEAERAAARDALQQARKQD